MKSGNKLILVLVGLILGLSLLVTQSARFAFAQQGVVQKQRLQEDINDTKRQYLGQMETYLQKERSYSIAKNQFLRHQTLNSIEAAVRSTQEVMASRVEVLTTYFKLIKLKLIEAEGVEVSEKQKALNHLDTSLEKLENQAQVVREIKDREDVAQAAAIFEDEMITIKDSAYHGLSLLTIGKLQATFDKAVVLEKKIKQADYQPKSLAKQSEQQRAFAETSKLMEEVQLKLSQQWALISEEDLGKRKYENYFRTLFGDLNLIYARLSQAVSYLEELLTYGQEE